MGKCSDASTCACPCPPEDLHKWRNSIRLPARRPGRRELADPQWTYLHRSTGNPGTDPGAGWIQDARLFFDEGTVVGDVSDLPSEVWKGELAFAGACLGGLLPVPLSIATSAVLRLTFNTGHTVTISGRGVRLELCGEPSYVEEFNP